MATRFSSLITGLTLSERSLRFLATSTAVRRIPVPKNITITTMTQYKLDYPFKIAVKAQHMGNALPETLGSQGINQVHIAEP
jgi:bisphosphoglycerate-independent phosphoglycerate mutase (AlkP superfamily)